VHIIEFLDSTPPEKLASRFNPTRKMFLSTCDKPPYEIGNITKTTRRTVIAEAPSVIVTISTSFTSSMPITMRSISVCIVVQLRSSLFSWYLENPVIEEIYNEWSEPTILVTRYAASSARVFLSSAAFWSLVNFAEAAATARLYSSSMSA
jgi:hypothetical protein